MSSKILFVFEGEKTEGHIAESFSNYFDSEVVKIECFFCGDVYQLARLIENDPDLDTFTLLKSRPKNESLKDYQRIDFAEIYLFFDYDGHATGASDDSLETLLQVFNEETEAGKIFISYPMVEAIKHLNLSKLEEFKDLCVTAKNKIGYKNLVSGYCDKRFVNLKALTRVQWVIIIEQHLKKANYLVHMVFEFPNSIVEQEKIWQSQLNYHIQPNSAVSVLSGFPCFLLEYYGGERIKEFISKP